MFNGHTIHRRLFGGGGGVGPQILRDTHTHKLIQALLLGLYMRGGSRRCFDPKELQGKNSEMLLSVRMSLVRML